MQADRFVVSSENKEFYKCLLSLLGEGARMRDGLFGSGLDPLPLTLVPASRA
jgi:hypothetical protein